MRILFILEYYHPHVGGVETLFKNLTKHLVSGGHDVTVITNRFDDNLPKTESIDGVTIKRLSLRNRYLFTFLSVYRCIKEARKHDIIHTTSYNAAIPAYIASKWTNTKTIITFHEVWGELWFRLPWISFFSNRLHYFFEKIILKMRFDSFVAVSNYTAKMLSDNGVKEEVISRIYNGIDYSEFEPSEVKSINKKYHFLYFGRLGISKGVDVLLKAIKGLAAENVNFQLTLIYPHKNDNLSDHVYDLIKNYKIESYLKVMDSQPFDQLKAIIRSSDAVVIPSYSEGFCFAAAEVMALCTPIISSGQGALAEVVSGKYVQFDQMSPNHLTEKLLDAIQDKWSYKPVKKFPLDECIDEYVRLYLDLLNNKPS